MNVLAIETSSDQLSLALAYSGSVRSFDQVVGNRHAELVLPEIERLLEETGTRIDSLDAVVYGAGPGAFTGLRIACGVAQGLALARGLPVLGVGTLEALAEASGADRVIACIDARMGEIYHAAYQRAGRTWTSLNSPELVRPDELRVPDGGGWVGCGSGFRVHGAALGRRLGARLVRADPDALPRASAMLRLALPRIAAGEGQDPAEAVPLYVRDRVALKIQER
ncbi:MAG: tRNA (adenosine(37)-N6)-threonylcarbamoyltransferase complex dimerization subunit type 1 TsaB [Betaproteobacteria bacterium]|nr:tRNA (adenosine(37)-N6)-threonylcarbamoyltransferase complex dimerization subunit type 1 TsaB [Betaproteobacteria bacterium]